MTPHRFTNAPPAAPSAVLVLGARGRFGLAAVRAFAQAGWPVVAQARPGAGALPAIDGVQWLRADVHDTAALAAQAQDAQVVVHALNPAYTHRAWSDEAPALMDAAIAVARRLRATLMLPGNVYNYGHGMPAVLSEDTPQQPTTPMGKVRVQLEQRLQAATHDGVMRAVVLRAGSFFGSGTGSWLDLAIAKDLPRGRVTWPGPQGVVTAWAYLPDLAAALVKVAQHRHRLAAFDRLHFAGHAVTAQPWLQALHCEAVARGWLPAGQPLRMGSLPWPLLRLAGLAMPSMAALSSMRYLWTTPHSLDHSRLCALIGPEPHTPFGQAVHQSLDDLGWASRAIPHPVAA